MSEIKNPQESITFRDSAPYILGAAVAIASLFGLHHIDPNLFVDASNMTFNLMATTGEHAIGFAADVLCNFNNIHVDVPGIK